MKMKLIKLLLVIILLVLPLGNASANMAAPFSFGSAAAGNFITNPKNSISIESEDLRFEIPGTTLLNGKVYGSPSEVVAHISYKIVNSSSDAKFTFVFPVFRVPQSYFNVEVNHKRIPFETKNLDEVEALFKNNVEKEKLKNLVSLEDWIYFDPLTNKEYTTPYIYGMPEVEFFMFDIFLPKGIPTLVDVNFNSVASSDTRRYQKNIYHYYYILDVGSYYSSFKNLKITITYPKSYILTSNLSGNILEQGEAKILTIVPEKTSKNLSFSYIEGGISEIGIFFYRTFPFLYGEAFGFFMILIVLPLIIIGGIIVLIFIIIRRRVRSLKN
ncbi:MAG: hypothetical protein ACP5SB_04165 [Caldisericaceae bacterium]